jgi:hypothetical protein
VLTIIDYIASKAERYAELPFYRFLRDERIDARKRLAFVPGVAHFVMTFADLYAMVLREEPARDRFQEIVNAHTYEDGGHWKWYLADLVALHGEQAATFEETLRFVWGPSTAKIRMLSYRVCRLGLGVSSLQKLVLVECIEAAGKVSLSNVSAAGAAMSARLGRNLVYFGPHHLETEQSHTVEEEGVQDWLRAVSLDPDTRSQLIVLIDEAFAAFTEFSHELLSFAVAEPPLREAAC